MKKDFPRMWRSMLSMLLVVCLTVGLLPMTAFAAETEETINYVSIGDSMANGYGFAGYNQTSDDRGVYDFMTGKGMYGTGAYPNQFEDYLIELGYKVNHTKLATSAMLAEDLLYLLGGREAFDDGWAGYKDYVGTYSDAELMPYIQNAVTEADVITMGIGNAAFGAFMMHKLTDALGVFGASLDENEKVDFEDAIGVLKLDNEQYALVMQVYDMLESKLINEVPADMVEQYNLADVVDLLAYTTASYVVNYKLLIEKILEMNPDVEIVLVGLLNTTYGINITDENGNVILPFGDVMDSMFSILNAYMAGLPAVMQTMGVAEEAKLYYAEQPNPKFICQEFENLLDNNWVAEDSRLDGNIIRQRNIDAFNDELGEMIGKAVVGESLAVITLEDIVAYDGVKWGVGQDPDKQLAVAIYLAIEEAVARSTNTMDIPVSGLIKIAGDLSSVFSDLGPSPESSPEDIRKWLLEGLSTEEIQGMCKVYGLFKVGNGMSVHPTPEGHDNIAASVIASYGKHTVQDETIENVEIALNELYKLLETYGPEVAAQVWAQWEEYGYVDAVEKSMTELEEMIKARYEYYTETALPAVEEAVNELSAQKDELTAELIDLKAQLEVKKAELEKVIAEQEIGSVNAPNINIDVTIGDNQQTTVPGNDCNVEGGDIQAELEAAVKDLEHAITVIEALINDVEADIADMVELAKEIAEAIGELEKTLTEVAEAAEDLKVAFDAVVEVLTDDSSKEIVDTVITSFEAARDTALAAAKVLELTMGTADEMMSDINTMIEKLVADGEALYNKFITELPGCIDQIPEEVQMLIGASAVGIQEAAKLAQAEIETKLAEDIAALEAEYADDIANAKAELVELEAKIKAEIEAKYAEIAAGIEAEYNAQIAELEAKKAALEAELNGYKAELEALAEDAAAEVREGLQAQIDRVTNDLAVVNEDLACALGHLDSALQQAYEQVVAEVEQAYAELKAELEEVLADLKAELEQAIEDLKAAADKSIQDLIDEVNKKLDELGEIGEKLSDAFDSILESIHEEMAKAQKAFEELLSGSIDSIEDLKDALIDMGADALAELVDELVETINDLLEAATTADLTIDDEFKYVAIGDGSAAPESYVEKLTAALNAEAAENGVDEIEVVNNAYVGNTVAAERANLSDVSDADLITIGFSNVEFLNQAVASAMSEDAEELDWAAVVGEENVQYVEQLLDEVAAKIAEAGIEGENAILVNTAIEAYAYAAMQYATEIPELVNDIHAVNADALVIIVGMYNPMEGVTIALDENTTLEIGEYIDYLVKGVGVHGVAYSILSGNSIYVDAPEVDTINADAELSIIELAKMAFNNFQALYPNAVGDDYIAAEIADALNITYVKSEVPGLLGDANSDGIVDSYDATLIMKYDVGMIGAEDLDLSVCDVDGDGVVDSYDATLIQKYDVGMIAKFPAEA